MLFVRYTCIHLFFTSSFTHFYSCFFGYTNGYKTNKHKNINILLNILYAVVACGQLTSCVLKNVSSSVQGLSLCFGFLARREETRARGACAADRLEHSQRSSSYGFHRIY
jgi:hypothetical protein